MDGQTPNWYRFQKPRNQRCRLTNPFFKRCGLNHLNIYRDCSFSLGHNVETILFSAFQKDYASQGCGICAVPVLLSVPRRRVHDDFIMHLIRRLQRHVSRKGMAFLAHTVRRYMGYGFFASTRSQSFRALRMTGLCFQKVRGRNRPRTEKRMALLAATQSFPSKPQYAKLSLRFCRSRKRKLCFDNYSIVWQ